MARNLVSAGISFGELDLSQVAQVTALMGPAIVGTTQSGPAFKPTTINNYSTEFIPIYGGLNKAHYAPYTTKFYLEHGSAATICRILGTESTGKANDDGFVVPASASWYDIIGGVPYSGSTTALHSNALIPLAVLRQRSGSTVTTLTTSASTINGQLTWTVNVDGSPFRFIPDEIESVFTRDAINIPASPACSALYLDVLYYSQAVENNADSVPSMRDITYYAMSSVASNKITGANTQGAYDHAITPWIVGAPDINGVVQNLFKFHSLSDGDESNFDCKISLDNITRKTDSFGNPYFTFDVLVRQWNDSDKNMRIFEKFSDCNLLTNDRNYIVKKIGDINEYFNVSTNRMDITGTWPNKSKFIRVEVGEGIAMGARPSGFRAPETFNLSSDGFTAYPFRCWKVNQVNGSQVYNKNIFLGYEGNAYGADCILYGPIAAASDKGVLLYDSQNWSGSATEIQAVTGTSLSSSFHLIPLFSSKAAYTSGVAARGTVIGGAVDLKFTIPMYGGLNGYRKSLAGSSLITSLSGEYQKAITLLENADIYDFNMLVIPGTIATYASHSSIIEQAIDMVETRGDAFYIADMFSITADNAAEPDNTSVENFDTSYAATYWPWIKIYDNENEDYVWVPSSVLVCAQMAYNDKVAFPWYAPGGVNRGHIANAKAARYQLTQEDRDTLASYRINPIATFRNEGVVVWGQKTLQKTSSSLDRVNVRRLLIYAKKLIARIGLKLLFEPNNATTWNKFKDQVNPILADIAANNGLQSFKIIMDATTNTPDRIDRNEMYGQIEIVATRAAEALYVDFISNRSGVEFSS